MRIDSLHDNLSDLILLLITLLLLIVFSIYLRVLFRNSLEAVLPNAAQGISAAVVLTAV